MNFVVVDIVRFSFRGSPFHASAMDAVEASTEPSPGCATWRGGRVRFAADSARSARPVSTEVARTDAIERSRAMNVMRFET